MIIVHLRCRTLFPPKSSDLDRITYEWNIVCYINYGRVGVVLTCGFLAFYISISPITASDTELQGLMSVIDKQLGFVGWL
jgi:hypothetical protein